MSRLLLDSTVLIDALRGRPMGERLVGLRRRDFARQGVTLHQADCLIAAAAVGVGAGLATANVSDFPMPELTLEHWDEVSCRPSRQATRALAATARRPPGEATR